MAEYIDREKAINLLWLFADESCCSIVSDVENLPAADVTPTVDAVEVVRCRDCKWFDPIKQECCGNVVTDNEGGADFTINFEENDFCSFGERLTIKSQSPISE